MMLAVKAKEKLHLIRKTGCPDGKWIVKNAYSGLRELRVILHMSR